MNTHSFLSALLITLLSASSALGKPPSDIDAGSMLIGNWVVAREQYNTVHKGGGFTFKRDGTFSSYGIFARADEQIRIDVKGKWTIKGGILTEELTSSSHPEIVAAGLVTRDTLLAVTNKEYRTRNERGVVQSYLRR